MERDAFPLPAPDRHALGRQRRLRPRQQRALLRVLRHGDQRVADPRGRARPPARRRDRAVRGVALRLHGGDRVPRRGRGRAAGRRTSAARACATSWRCSRRATAEPAATGWFVHVFVDRATRRPVAVPGAAARGAGAAGMSARETVFTLEATPVKFGPGAAADAGWELARLGVTRALLVTDPGVAAAGHAEARARRRRGGGDRRSSSTTGRGWSRTLDSLEAAAAFARDAGVDGFVSVGGGSAMDTAKVADLIVVAPGGGDGLRQPAGRRGPQAARAAAPHLAIPTTPGTGSRGDDGGRARHPRRCKLKTGISHRYLRPAQAIVDPELARTLGPEVTASAGLDVVCHAAESYLSRPYGDRPRPATPDERPPYQGANPVADVWSAKALEYGGRFLRRAVARRGRRRGARGDDARRDDGGRRLRLGRRAHPARVRLSDRGPEARLRAARLSRRPPFVPHGHSVIVTAPGRVPLHLRGRRPSATSTSPRC